MTGEPQKEYIITEEKLRQFFDAWMFSTKDARILHKIYDAIRSHPYHSDNTSDVLDKLEKWIVEQPDTVVSLWELQEQIRKLQSQQQAKERERMRKEMTR